MLEHDSGTLESVLLCLIVAAIVGGVSYAVLAYGFKVAWANLAGALIFLIVLALCLL